MRCTCMWMKGKSNQHTVLNGFGFTHTEIQNALFTFCVLHLRWTKERTTDLAITENAFRAFVSCSLNVWSSVFVVFVFHSHSHRFILLLKLCHQHAVVHDDEKSENYCSIHIDESHASQNERESPQNRFIGFGNRIFVYCFCCRKK